MQTALLGASGAGLLILGFVLWMWSRSTRKVGALEERETQLTSIIDAAGRITDATENAPDTVDDLDRRLQRGGHI